MLPTLPPNVQSELAGLAARYGRPRVDTVQLELAGRCEPLSSRDRYGEVCMVVRRPSGRLLTAIKTYYPRGAYRLLTGGIQHHEPVLAALQREVAEETGLQVELRRFLAAVAYTDESNPTPLFYTFAFLLDEVGGTLGVSDPAEQLESFREVQVAELPRMADFLDQLAADYHPKIKGRWSDWGRFRAVIHRVVWEALTAGAG